MALICVELFSNRDNAEIARLDPDLVLPGLCVESEWSSVDRIPCVYVLARERESRARCFVEKYA